jgi:positive regulator of sigma E activity
MEENAADSELEIRIDRGFRKSDLGKLLFGEFGLMFLLHFGEVDSWLFTIGLAFPLLIAGIGYLISRRYRLVIREDSITQKVIREKTIALASIEKLQWYAYQSMRGVTITTANGKMQIPFHMFSFDQYRRLTDRLRELVPQRLQHDWENFSKHDVATEKEFESAKNDVPYLRSLFFVMFIVITTTLVAMMGFNEVAIIGIVAAGLTLLFYDWRLRKKQERSKLE